MSTLGFSASFAVGLCALVLLIRCVYPKVIGIWGMGRNLCCSDCKVKAMGLHSCRTSGIPGQSQVSLCYKPQSLVFRSGDKSACTHICLKLWTLFWAIFLTGVAQPSVYYVRGKQVGRKREV